MEDKKLKGAVFYLNHGNGFKGPAEIISAELTEAGVEAQALDCFKTFGSRFFDWLWKIFWTSSLKNPVGLKFHMNLKMNFFGTSLIKFYEAVHFVFLARKARKWVEEEKPDFVVAAHFAMIIFLPLVFKKYEIPVIGYNTEVITAHLPSISQKLDSYLVSTEEGRLKMAELGQPQESMELIPFPLNSQFRKRFAGQAKEREKLGLENIFTVLLSFGGDGMGSVDMVREIAEKKPDVQVLAVCGNNAQKKEELEQLKIAYPSFRLKVYGFVDNMHQLLYCSDLSVGKAGMNTSMEALYLKKPMIITHAYVNEERMVNYILSHEYGWDCRGDDKKVISVIEDSLNDPKVLTSMVRKMGQTTVSFENNLIAEKIKEIVFSHKKKILKKRPALFFDMAGTLCDIPIGGQWEKVNLEGIKKVITYLKWGSWLSESELEEMARGFVFRKAQLRKEAKKEFREFDIKKQLLDFIDKSMAEHSLPKRSDFTPREINTMEKLFVSTELDITVPFNGITPLLTELSQKYDLYCLSNNVSRILVNDILDKIGCRELFKGIYVSVDCGYRKPDARFLKYVLKATGKKPDEAVMIGDRLSQDIRFANLCQMRSIYIGIVDHEDNKGEGHENYDIFVEEINDLKNLLI